MNKKPTLLVLAAGMGSRYGGLKQMDAFGPSGETIIDYSVYDAIKAGFGKVVFIIREHFKEAFQEAFDKKFSGKIIVEYVTQELHKIPESKVHPERQKPWGTGHAVLVAKDYIEEPFVVINADDFYGPESFQEVASYFAQNENGTDYAVVAYHLKNTLSDHGTVNRGVCYKDKENHLTKVVECTKISRKADNSISFKDDNEQVQVLDEDTLVSMNMWGFRPSYFQHCERKFSKFLDERGMELKSEYFIPKLIDDLINENVLHVDVIDTEASWFGVTYQEDKPIVIEKLRKLIAAGVYPENLWEV